MPHFLRRDSQVIQVKTKGIFGGDSGCWHALRSWSMHSAFIACRLRYKPKACLCTLPLAFCNFARWLFELKWYIHNKYIKMKETIRFLGIDSWGGLPVSMYRAAPTVASQLSVLGRICLQLADLDAYFHFFQCSWVVGISLPRGRPGLHKAGVPDAGERQDGLAPPWLTFDSTSALLSFCSSRAAAFVSSFRAAIWRAGRRTFPLVSFSSRSETTWSWPCCKATASGVKPSCEGVDGSRLISVAIFSN